MTQSTIAPTSRTRPVSRALPVVALIAGGALIIDTVTIAVVNRSFDPLDSFIFFVGFIGMIVTGVLFGAELSRTRRGAGRMVLGVGVLLLFTAVLGAISFAFDQMGRHVFSASNMGLHGEWSFFSIGVCLLLVARWAVRRVRRLETAPVRPSR